MSTPLPLLLALGLNELVTALVVFASLAIWVISQIADAKKKQQAQAQRHPAAPPPGRGDQPDMARVQPAAADPVRAQVDDFLRRAGQQGPPLGAKPAPPPRRAVRGDEIEVLVEAEPAEPPRRPLAEPLRPMGEVAAAPPPPIHPLRKPPRRAVPLRQQSVAEHVAAHVGSAVEQIRQEVSHLGEAVITADEQFDVQLQQKFDHELGSLRTHHLTPVQAQQAAEQVDTPASQIAAMLTSPEGVRQAIVVNEILRRPEERW